jgi:hypothetical protein
LSLSSIPSSPILLPTSVISRLSSLLTFNLPSSYMMYDLDAHTFFIHIRRLNLTMHLSFTKICHKDIKQMKWYMIISLYLVYKPLLRFELSPHSRLY